MDSNMKIKWEKLHSQGRFRPKYPAGIVVQFVFRNFERNGESKVLDIGCGAGRHVCFMAKENIHAYGVDISKEGVDFTNKILKQEGLNGEAQVATVDQLPFKDDYFEGLMCYGVLYYCKKDEIQKAIKEMYRVLKSDGLGLLVVRNTGDYRFGVGKEIENNTFIIEEKDENKCAFNENGMTMHFFVREELKELFKEFRNVEIDEIIETHNNGKHNDANFIIKFQK
ncbi:class I SAM-dependent methyltransferase [Clostridium estertheticum]|uniref:Class I SAM-dependent methyltransferase n=1 Tax=Clostridium estertheticum TaxID=238834 RepID=A0A5N7J398_9CLOT|nr:class I SAM-dependent methyltransferase [Clostridium estertheticum]MPQ32555.1 class I SAM-dependent methyltransferase [Clostridium estertheticum]MPQ63214.1 class I SAM-dependent methyltransferase [Clostridium estertheticum]